MIDGAAGIGNEKVPYNEFGGRAGSRANGFEDFDTFRRVPVMEDKAHVIDSGCFDRLGFEDIMN